MSTNFRQSGSVGNSPSRSDLITFAKSLNAKLAAINLTPEQAVDSEKVRPLLIDYYRKAQDDQVSAQLARAEDAAVAMFKDELGITPEVERVQSVSDWAINFGQNMTDKMPTLRTDETKQNFFCGLDESVPCCDKKHQVNAFAILGDMFYGICQNAVGAYKTATMELGRRPRLFYRNLAETKRVLEDRKQAAPIVNWVYPFAYGKVENPPVQRKNAEGQYLCGLPENVPCCDHTQPAARYAVHDAVIYGLCQRAMDVYSQCYIDTGINSVKFSNSVEKLTSIAASQAKDKPLFDWVDQFATLTATEWPVGKMNEDRVYVCGVPDSAGCCDHTQLAERFAVYDGEVYGVCKKANWAYRMAGIRHGDLYCLKSTDDFEKAVGIAEWQRNDSTDNNHSSGAKKSPLGNQTPPDGRKKSEKRKKDRSERDKEFHSNKPEPNTGSGDIAAQSMGKGKKK